MIEVLLNGITIGCFLALCGFGFTLLFRLTKYLHLAYGELIITSAYVCLACSYVGMNVFQAIIFIIPLVILLGFLFAKLSPLGTEDWLVLVTSLGVMCIIQAFNEKMWTGSYVSVPLGIFGVKYLWLSLGRYCVILLTALVFTILHLIFKKTNFGLKYRAASSDFEEAKAAGIDVRRIYSLTFIIVALMAGIAGIDVALLYAFNPYEGLHYLVYAILISIIGGPGSITGALMIGLIFGVIIVLANYFIGALYEGIILFLSLILILLLKPKGLMTRI
jgi:branched-chain amino acid transport system permease protein